MLQATGSPAAAAVARASLGWDRRENAEFDRRISGPKRGGGLEGMGKVDQSLVCCLGGNINVILTS